MAEKKSILALNLGSQRIGMARFSVGSKGSLLLREYAFEEIPGDISSDALRKSSVSSAVKALASRLKAREIPANYAVPSANAITRFVKLPSLGEEQVDKIVGFEAQQAVPFPLTETVWDYQIMGKEGGEVEVAIAAVRNDQLEEMNQAVRAAGLEVRMVDAAPLSLYNAFRYNYGVVDQPTLLVDLGAKTTDLIFMEGDKLWISSFQNAGAQITQAVSKELEMDFGTAEEKKRTVGFVHLGGNYADHEDPEIDSISKVIRNQLTRLHGDINRRTQQYRQQGGNAPAIVYLCGAGASLPYLKEFFEDKLRVPVEWFNGLKNVAVGPKVNVDQVAKEAHLLGELVGLALRETSCPMELDLSPKSVESARSVSAKKPVLLAAAASLVAGLGALWAYLHISTSAQEARYEKLEKESKDLQGQYDLVKKEETRQKEAEARDGFLRDAAHGRSNWVSILNAINNQMGSSAVWLTQLEPLDEAGEPILPKPLFASTVAVPEDFKTPVSIVNPKDKKAAAAAAAAADADTVTVASLHVAGLWSKNEVKQLFQKLKDLKDYFDIPDTWEDDPDKWLKVDTGRETTHWAGNFEMKLPLKNKFRVKRPQKQEG